MVFNAIIEKDDFGYFAYVPELKGCVSCGDSYEDTIDNIKEAVSLYIESLNKEELDLLKSKTVLISSIEVALSA